MLVFILFYFHHQCGLISIITYNQVAGCTNSKLIDKYVDSQTKYDLIDVVSFLKSFCNIFIVHK